MADITWEDVARFMVAQRDEKLSIAQQLLDQIDLADDAREILLRLTKRTIERCFERVAVMSYGNMDWTEIAPAKIIDDQGYYWTYDVIGNVFKICVHGIWRIADPRSFVPRDEERGLWGTRWQ